MRGGLIAELGEVIGEPIRIEDLAISRILLR